MSPESFGVGVRGSGLMTPGPEWMGLYIVSYARHAEPQSSLLYGLIQQSEVVIYKIDLDRITKAPAPAGLETAKDIRKVSFGDISTATTGRLCNSVSVAAAMQHLICGLIRRFDIIGNA
jgi:hypothetical protein